MSLIGVGLRAAAMFAASLAISVTAKSDDFRLLPANVVSVEDCTHERPLAVVGDAEVQSRVRAYLWTKQDDLEIVGTLGVESHAAAVSDDGSVVVGDMLTVNGQTHGFVWTETSGTVDIGSLGGNYTVATDVSANGAFVVGTSVNEDGFREAFRATLDQALAGTLIGLGTLGGNNSEALFVSANGATVVGRSQVADGDWHLFLWTQADGMIDLGSFGGADVDVRDVSDDASVIVGRARRADGMWVPFMWTQATGLKRVRGVGDVNGTVEFVSDDGNLIFGQAWIGGGALTAFQFDVDAVSVLPLGSLFKQRASFVSSASLDGSVIGGQSFDSKGRLEAFLRVESATPPGFLKQGRLIPLKRILRKVFGPQTVKDFFFVDVPCISHDGKTLIAEARRSGEKVFAYVEIEAYLDLGDDDGGKFFATRPYRAEIEQYVNLSLETAYNLSQFYSNVEIAYYVYLYAYYASEYQKLAADLEIDGEVDAKLRGLYASYRYNSLLLTYYGYVYHYYYVYLPSGGTAQYSSDLLTYLYYSYYFQLLDLEDLLENGNGDEDDDESDG